MCNCFTFRTAPSGTYFPCSIHKSGVSATDSNGTNIKTSPVIFGQLKAREEDLNEAREVESCEGFENTSGYSEQATQKLCPISIPCS